MSLAEDIKSLAYEAGFHAVGITSAEPFMEAEKTLREHLKRGLLEGSRFQYPENIHSHTHPLETMPTAKSIISVALSYLTDDSGQPPAASSQQPPRGLLSRYARGRDYHGLVQDRLAALVNSIQSSLGSSADKRSIVDTGPLVDRSVAICAGVGSPGKNTCVYTKEYGSWVVLGELITDIELETDTPAPLEICGKCDECIKACPTGAICSPHAVDQNLCISKVSTLKGFIPHRLREKMGPRIYGCDVCQSVCPLNKKAKPGNIDGFRPSAELGNNPELLPLLNMTQEEFDIRIAPTTAGWIKRTRFRRNVAVVLGNIGDPAAVPGLVEALSDPEPVIRGHAAWALGKIGSSQSRLALENALARETDEQVTEEIRMALD